MWFPFAAAASPTALSWLRFQFILIFFFVFSCFVLFLFACLPIEFTNNVLPYSFNWNTFPFNCFHEPSFLLVYLIDFYFSFNITGFRLSLQTVFLLIVFIKKFSLSPRCFLSSFNLGHVLASYFIYRFASVIRLFSSSVSHPSFL